MNNHVERQAMLDIVRRLEDKGFNHGSSGNVSLRAGEGALITPIGAHTGNLTPQRLSCSSTRTAQ